MQHYMRCAEINGLEVRVLPGSPSLFNDLASFDFSLKTNCAQFCATPGSKPLSLRSSTARRLASIRICEFSMAVRHQLAFHGNYGRPKKGKSQDDATARVTSRKADARRSQNTSTLVSSAKNVQRTDVLSIRISKRWFLASRRREPPVQEVCSDRERR